jgi:hypothetical protein
MNDKEIYHKISQVLIDSISSESDMIILEVSYDEDTIITHAIIVDSDDKNISIRLPNDTLDTIIDMTYSLRQIIFDKSGSYFQSYIFECKRDGNFNVEYNYK